MMFCKEDLTIVVTMDFWRIGFFETYVMEDSLWLLAVPNLVSNLFSVASHTNLSFTLRI